MGLNCRSMQKAISTCLMKVKSYTCALQCLLIAVLAVIVATPQLATLLRKSCCEDYQSTLIELSILSRFLILGVRHPCQSSCDVKKILSVQAFKLTDDP